MKRLTIIPIAILMAIMSLTASAQQFSSKAFIGSARQSLERKFPKSYRNLRVVDDLGQMVVVSSTNGGTAYIDKSANRVLGITPSSYSKDNVVPCGMQMWIDAANNSIKNGVTQQKTYQSSSVADVEPFMTTEWDQGEPYYNKCPQSGVKRCLTGCVATAMAQVMNYFEYPAKGHGTSTFTVATSSGKESTRTGAINGEYDWANMLDSYSDGYTDAQATAVATLMRDCGYSVHMSYSKYESAASDFYIPSALAYNFDYDSLSVNFLWHEYCTDEEWYDAIYSELAAKRPVLFAGQSVSTGGGHEFVLDGMSADGKVHVNWGWGGVGNGYFDLSVFSSTYDFTLDQCIVYGFNPQPTPENSQETYPSLIIIRSPELSTDNGQLYLGGVVFNGDWRVFVGDVVMTVQDVEDEDTFYKVYFMKAPTSEEKDCLLGSYGWFMEDDDLLDFNSYFVDDKTKKTFVFPASTYEVSFKYKSINDDQEKTAVTDGGLEWKQKFTVDGSGNITFINSTGIVTPTINRCSAIDDAKVYDLNGNRVSSSFKGLKIVKGKKYVE